ncbi:MAG: rhodanese-like domain-containing protein [Nitrososphaerota archaeon]|jgi:rhodanese-related sulfurtransferase|nr:rhodanese-like domain-containing protein [Nitrososphaerota archaeon]
MKNLVKNISISVILFALLSAPFVVVQSVVANPPLPSIQNITVQEAEHMMKTTKDLLILDVRNETEYNYGHLYNAFWIPLHELEDRLGELTNKQNSPILIYCGIVGRSAVAHQILTEHEFTKVYNMLGGITAWIDADYPIYTIYHHAIIDIIDNHVLIDIKPELVYQTGNECIPCALNPEDGSEENCDECVTPDVEITVLKESDGHFSIFVT